MPDRVVISVPQPQDPIPLFIVGIGESVDEVLTRLGCGVSIEWVPPPTELERIAARAQEVGAEVSALLRFCRTVEDVPAPDHLPRPDDNCTICDARRIVAEMLGGEMSFDEFDTRNLAKVGSLPHRGDYGEATTAGCPVHGRRR